MKPILIAITVVVITGLIACTSKQNSSKPDESTEKKISPIEGNWITVSFEQNGKITHPKRVPQEFKMFHDGYFSFIMYDTSGKFSIAGAGPYEINGNMYKETVGYCSWDTSYLNSKDWQKWEMKGDTLIFYGFEKAEMPDGKDVTSDWNAGGRFIEKRVRVKK
jgi:hypothetical protein